MNNNNNPLINLIDQLPDPASRGTREYREVSNEVFRQVQNLIQENENSINERDYENNTPLHFVIAKRNNVIMRLLLQNGADVNAQNSRGDTPLHFSVYPPGYLQGVHTLLEFNADNTIRNSQQGTPLEIATDIVEHVQDIDYDEYEDIITQLEDHIVRPTPVRLNNATEEKLWENYNPGDECSICFEELSDGRQICLNNNCEHGYHCECIRRWLRSSNSCPLCRERVELMPLNELQQRALQNSFGKRKKLGLKQLLTFERYLKRIK